MPSRIKAPKSDLEETFLFYWSMAYASLTEHLPPIERELTPIEGRNFAFDFGFSEARVLIEIQGGTWRMGRHTRHQGYSNDWAKYNMATSLGYLTLAYTSDWFDGKLIYQGRGKKKALVEERSPESMVAQIVSVVDSRLTIS